MSPSASRPLSSSLSDSSVDEGRYLPGTILLERYRIIAILGRGGMGEVYRATDLKLGQQVALKFLPASASPEALARFKAEVRVARQISHRNVCRVYDIGDVEGAHFLSMEYVQGEDLASLLRRIGRLPGDKALEIARQLCAGLAAAHEKGVLHRDLKPANVLIDSEGSVVIADFGLAAAEEIRAGTPAYMAPEQLEGREVTVCSDIYSLGLVLYEVFCGRRALQANSMVELQNLHLTPRESPSSFVPDIDPAVERVILQCLESDPQMRPESVRAVSAALPGGDPLAAALAAGETPSPALVAAAGRALGITPRAALVIFALILAGFAGIWFALASMNDLIAAGVETPPDIMADRARTLLQALDYTEKPAGSAWGFRNSDDYLQYRRLPGHSAVRFAPVHFWYRSSKERLVNFDPVRAGVVIGNVTAMSPPPVQSGMLNASLDPRGRLLRFQYVTPEQEPQAASKPVDWSAVLRTAGYDPARFRSAEPQWLSDGATDTRAAWVGRDPSLSSEEFRIEAASWKGRLVYFQTVFPWTEPLRQPRADPPGQRPLQIFSFIILAALLTFGIVMARRNLLAGRGDRKGAGRLASFVFFLHMTAFALGADHVLDIAEIPLIGIATSVGLLKAAILWVAYIALEPAARRRWPQSLISWTRLLDGRWNDPLAGRDLLIGCLAAVVACIPILLLAAWDRAYGDVKSSLPSAWMLSQTRIVLAWLVNAAGEALRSTLITFLILFFARTVFRKDWLAVIVCGVLFGLPTGFGAPSFWPGFLIGAIVNTLAFTVAARAGLTSLFAFLLLLSPLLTVAPNLDLSVWYASNGLLFYALLAALAAFAFRSALAGRRVLG